MPADFADLGPRDAEDQVLHRLVRAGTIRRITRGLYDKPSLNALTGKSTNPDPRAIIDALARHGFARMIVDGVGDDDARRYRCQNYAVVGPKRARCFFNKIHDAHYSDPYRLKSSNRTGCLADLMDLGGKADSHLTPRCYEIVIQGKPVGKSEVTITQE